MRKYATGALIALLPGLVLSAPVVAQQTRQDRDATSTRQSSSDRATATDRKSEDHQAWENRQGLVEGSRLVGAKVMNTEGKDIGKIDQLMVDAKTGKVSDVVISMGGALGVGGTKVVVPWADVKVGAGERSTDHLVARVEQSLLDRAPRFDKNVAREGEREHTPAASPSTQPRRNMKGDHDRGERK